jgi:hypothetical protein
MKGGESSFKGKWCLFRKGLQYIKNRISLFYDKIESEGEKRAEEREFDKYNKRYIIVPLALVCLISIYFVIESLTLPKDHEATVQRFLGEHLTYEKAIVWFGDEKNNVHEITIPDRNLERFSDFDKSNINYEIEINIPKEHFSEKETGFITTRPWGKSTIWINGELENFGQKLPIIYPLMKADNTVKINVDATGMWKYGIRGVFPILVDDIDELRELNKFFTKYEDRTYRVLIAHTVTFIILLMLFLSAPRKPELFAFVTLFFLNIAYTVALIYIGWQGGTIPYLKIIDSRELLSIIGLSRKMALFWFVLEYFRFRKKIYRNLVFNYLLAIFGCLIATGIIVSLEAEPLPWHIFLELMVEVVTLSFCLILGLFLVSFLVFRIKHYIRAALSLLLLVTIGYALASNAADLFYYFQRSGSNYLNNFYTFFVIIMIAVFEFARTEQQNERIRKILPKEAQKKFQNPFSKEAPYHQGYIMLVDIVSFSLMQDKLSPKDQGRFAEEVLSHILNHFDDSSLLGMTGDGFYFGWKEAYTRERLFRKLAQVHSLFQDPLSTRHLGFKELPPQKIRYRVAMNYGNYSVGILTTEGLSSAFATGSSLSELQRIIGGGEEQRIRIGDLEVVNLDHLSKVVETPIQWIQDKHGKSHLYLELSDLNLANLYQTAA